MQADTFYHIYNRANGSENLFREPENYRYYLQQWDKYIAPVASTLAYCLMPNHFHFLIKTLEENKLKKNYSTLGKFQTFQELMSFRISKQFANLFSSYTQSYNKMYGRKGSLFSPNFKKKEIDSDSYLTSIILYIHHNPIHHGFTKTIGSWPHCSYNVILNNKPSFLDAASVLDWFGNKNAMASCHKQAVQIKKAEKEFEKQFV